MLIKLHIIIPWRGAQIEQGKILGRAVDKACRFDYDEDWDDLLLALYLPGNEGVIGRPFMSAYGENHGHRGGSLALINRRTGEVVALRVVECDTLLTKARGLMFRRTLPPDEVYVFVADRESIALTAIHMLFVFFPIAVLWLNDAYEVVDLTLARPFRFYYAPRRPARYFIEGDPLLLDRVRVGDRLDWDRPKVHDIMMSTEGTSDDIGLPA